MSELERERVWVRKGGGTETYSERTPIGAPSGVRRSRKGAASQSGTCRGGGAGGVSRLGS